MGAAMNLGPHAAFIIAAYAIATIVIASLIGWVIVDYRRQRTILRDLEARGLTRRSARPTSTPS
jgi:heme exporter protein D